MPPIRNRIDMQAEARQRVADTIELPPGYSVAWSGQFDDAQRAGERLTWVVPATISIIFLLLSFSP